MKSKLTSKIALVAVMFGSCPTISQAEAVPPKVRVEQGALEGKALGAEGGIFLGIPFAAPPVKQLRWSSPRAPASWSGIRKADSFGHSCMQIDMGWNADAARDMSEDCLYLNVHSPDIHHRGKLPVMVWIHGGAFSGGAGSQDVYEGTALASRGVVLVTINYRLGAFGFFSHPDLHGPLQANFGLADQMAALMWVKANIAAFGGNPNNVTIFGQSAGGASVLSLVTSPKARDLFRRAIVQSGAIHGMPVPTLAQARVTGRQFAGGATMAELLAMPAERVLALAAPTDGRGPIQFGPTVDANILQMAPAEAFARHREARVPLLVGSNSREALSDLSEQSFPAAIRNLFGTASDKANALYLDAPAHPVLGTRVEQFLTDTGFRCGAVLAVKRHAALTTATWQYQFEQALPSHRDGGAQHSDDLPYVFGNFLPSGMLGGTFTSADRALSQRMMAYWVNFARTGNPNGASLPYWPSAAIPSRPYLRFSGALADQVQVANDLRPAQCALIERAVREH